MQAARLDQLRRTRPHQGNEGLRERQREDTGSCEYLAVQVQPLLDD